MYAPFTAETGTGTTGDITLTAAVSGNNRFNATFSVGDSVAYVIEDGNGDDIVAGIGTYSALNTISRDDKWHSDNGVVTRLPGTNFPLSGGTHTIRCDLTPFGIRAAYPEYHTRKFLSPCGTHGVTFGGFAANTIYYQQFEATGFKSYTTLGANLSAGAASSNMRIAIYYPSPSDGGPGELLVDSGLIDSTASGDREATGLSFQLYQPGRYWAAIQSDGAIDLTAGSQNELCIPLGAQSGNLPVMHMTTAFTFGAFPQTAQVSGLAYNTSRGFQIYAE